MKASLVYPCFEEFSSLDSTWMPHGIAHLATEARLKGHEIDVLDGRVLGRENTLQILSNTGAEVVGISCLSALTGYAKECITVLRNSKPDVKIVIGGLHPTVCPEDFAPWEYDWLVQGEGEVTWPAILSGDVPQGVITGERPSLNDLAFADRSLFRIKEEPMPGLAADFATIIIGRGCVHNCTFCQPAERKLFGNRVRMRPVEHVVAELETLGVDSFMVHDDCFTANQAYLEEFLNAIEDKGYTWWCQGRADNVCRHLDSVKRMVDCGLRGMILGHESGDQRVLDYLKKGATVQDNIMSIKLLKALGVTVWSNLMVGLPYEPPSALIHTIGMVHETEPDMTAISVFTPHPGSFLYDECKDRMPAHDYTYYNRGKFEPKIAGVDYEFCAWAANMMKAPELSRKPE